LILVCCLSCNLRILLRFILIASAWNSGRPIFSRLPGASGSYSENDLAQILTAFPDDLLIETRQRIFDIENIEIYPETASEEWLDYLSNVCGWDGYWDKGWSIEAKRSLILNSWEKIAVWKNKGSATVLQFVLRTIGVKGTITETAPFRVGVTAIGQPIGLNPYEFTVYLLEEYRGTRTVGVVDALTRKFCPVWCKYTIVFSNNFYSEVDLLVSDSTHALVIEPSMSGIQTN
jgi:hypothetical protein